MIKSIKEVLEIIKPEDLQKEFGEFETSIMVKINPLRLQLSKDVRTNEVPKLMDHMTDVERWRELCVRMLSLSTAFLSHAKSDHFSLVKTGKTTEFERAAYQKKLTAGFEGMVVYLEGLIYTIDSRVNLCKRLLGIDFEGSRQANKTY